jgi:hypothetical protein
MRGPRTRTCVSCPATTRRENLVAMRWVFLYKSFHRLSKLTCLVLACQVSWDLRVLCSGLRTHAPHYWFNKTPATQHSGSSMFPASSPLHVNITLGSPLIVRRSLALDKTRSDTPPQSWHEQNAPRYNCRSFLHADTLGQA